MSSNASLLDERRGSALVEAGLSTIYINVGERDQGYVDIYKLPFEKTRDNMIRFAEMAGDRCRVVVVLVDHRRDTAHIADMEQYWRSYGFDNFAKFDIMNRGGALFVDHQQYSDSPELATAQSMIAARNGEALCCGAVPLHLRGLRRQHLPVLLRLEEGGGGLHGLRRPRGVHRPEVRLRQRVANRSARRATSIPSTRWSTSSRPPARGWPTPRIPSGWPTSSPPTGPSCGRPSTRATTAPRPASASLSAPPDPSAPDRLARRRLPPAARVQSSRRRRPGWGRR